MSYFADRYSAVSFPIGSDDAPGLRNAQLGAIHAVASYFTLRPKSTSSNPALIVMPTGSGKTVVLLISAFLLRAERVLIVSPSRAVRNQIAGAAATLVALKQIGVLPEKLDTPRIYEVTGRLGTTDAWQRLDRYDVVVGTPNSISPGTPGVEQPPPMFDLLLMDEAHHSPAPTWKALLVAFADARKVLFTATPFRLDEKEIRAHPVYEYPLGQALDDDIICQLDYMPVNVPKGDDRDIVLARSAEEVLRAEQAKNSAYKLLVRTDSKAHAGELEKVYAEHTSLKLRTIHSGHSQRHIERSLSHLREGALDGVLCVDMLGEGFDFPPLKVAAIHRKHKSLPVTLQFIGRFGRVTRKPGISDEKEKAKILAVPEELEGEIEHLFEENSAWELVIPALHEARINKLLDTRCDLATFSVQLQELPAKLDEMSLWGLEPLAHVKIYEVEDEVDVNIACEIQLDSPFKVVYRAISQELSAQIFLAREIARPPWTKSDVTLFNRIEYDLFVVHWNAEARLLFISASRRGSIALYEEIAKKFTGQTGVKDGRSLCHHILPLYKINRVLRGHSDSNCFNVGMRNRQASLAFESYRILAGSEVDRALHKTDGRLYHRGHVFLGIPEEDRMVTLGYSSASKVWRGKYMRVPELVRWCRELAAQIKDDHPVEIGKNLDFLPVGEPLKELPDNLVAAAWGDEVFQRSFFLRYVANDNKEQECELYESTWSVDCDTADKRKVQLILEVDGKKWPILFSLDTSELFTSGMTASDLPRIYSYREQALLLNYLNSAPLQLFTADFSRLCGKEIFRAPEDFDPFGQSCFQSLGWIGVDITSELSWTAEPYTKGGFDKRSIQGFFADFLEKEGFPIIFYDHGTGEIADFIAIEERRRGDAMRWQHEQMKEQQDAVHVYIFHVKGAGGTSPGVRMSDAYEVCGQVVKSLIWVQKRTNLASRIMQRNKKKSFFLKGGLETARSFLTERKRLVNFHICLVQPGIKAAEAVKEQKILEVLAATDDYVRRAVGNPVFVFCSS